VQQFVMSPPFTSFRSQRRQGAVYLLIMMTVGLDATDEVQR
jgi:hypothetical protein